MAFVDTLGAANRGLARGALDFNTFMQTAADNNQLLANANEQALLQQMPIAGVSVPTSVAAPPLPTMPGKGVGLLPQPLDWQPTDTSQAGVAAMYGGINAQGATPVPGMNVPGQGATWQGVQDFRAGLQPGQVANSAFKDYFPNGKPFYEGPENSVWGNFSSGLGNFVYNLPGDLASGMMGSITAPYDHLGRPLFEPGYTGPHTVGGFTTDDSTDIPKAGPSATTPGVGVDAPSPAPGASSGSQPGTGSVGTPGLPGAAGGNAAPNALTEEFFPTEVRNQLLSADIGELGYIQQQLVAQREEITRSTNEALALAQQKADRLTQYARAAQQSGNVGRMRGYLDEADAIQAEMLAAQQTARASYLANDLQLWTQQAFQAEYEFRNMGDPTRLSQMMAAYGYPIAVEDAGNGSYNIVDITGEGQGSRRTGGPYSAQEISDMFMSLLSEEFRQMKATAEAERSGKMLDHAFDMDLEDLKGANTIAAKEAEALLSGGEYVTQADGNGNLVMTPKQPGSGKPVYIINSEPEVNPDGVPYGRITRETY